MPKNKCPALVHYGAKAAREDNVGNYSALQKYAYQWPRSTTALFMFGYNLEIALMRWKQRAVVNIALAAHNERP